MTPATSPRRWGAGLRALLGGHAIVAIVAVLVTAVAQPARAGPSLWPMAGHDARHTGLSAFGTSANNGELKWTFPNHLGLDTSPAIGADGTVYAFCDAGLCAINRDGSLKWQFEGGFPFGSGGSSPAIGPDGTNLHRL